jgi:hypothetical protein
MKQCVSQCSLGRMPHDAATQPGLSRVVYTSAGKAGHTALRSSYAGHSSKNIYIYSAFMAIAERGLFVGMSRVLTRQR